MLLGQYCYFMLIKSLLIQTVTHSIAKMDIIVKKRKKIESHCLKVLSYNDNEEGKLWVFQIAEEAKMMQWKIVIITVEVKNWVIKNQIC